MRIANHIRILTLIESLSVVLVLMVVPGWSQTSSASARGNRSVAALTPSERASIVLAQRGADYDAVVQANDMYYSKRARLTGDGAPPAAPTTSAPLPSLAERAGLVSREVHQLDATIIEQTEQLRARMQKLLKAHEAAPDFDVLAESERIVNFEKLLLLTWQLGYASIQDEVAFRQIFARWQLASGNASGIFRQAQAEFEEAASAAKYPEEREFLERSARWYAARATRLEIRSQMEIPSDVSQEMEHVKALVAAVAKLHGFVKVDPHFLDENAAEVQRTMTEFLQAFRMVGETLNQWTETLMKDLEPADANQAAREVSVEARPATVRPVAAPTTPVPAPRVRQASIRGASAAPATAPRSSFLAAVAAGTP